ncbi:competence protein ComK [Rummeliibacillus sp. SL167]|uniref:competence protein ComK n=1 Tax=Rummeliibacillus sp. SL167 TaxID=2579792 RepID=UPI0011B561B2|nr:competence protein ComK [Rummeliibacillus sp. SL167]
MLEDVYIVDENTMAFIPIFDHTGVVKTNILEVEYLKKCHLNPLELVDQNLRFFGSSLKGASEGTRNILGEVNMYPVIMNLKRLLVWLPTMSPKKKDCVWLALDHIKSYRQNHDRNTEILFTNDSSLILPISYRSFEKRIYRAYELKFKLEYHTKFLLIPHSIKRNFLRCEIVKEVNGLNYKIYSKDKNSEKESYDK